MGMSIRQVGVISDFTVIEAVGRTLAELLNTEMENPVPVTIASPGEDYGVPVAKNGEELSQSRINLFLYRVEESPFSKNNDWVDTGDGTQIPYPLTLNLYYMMNIFTPDKSSNLDEHRILGDVMRVFHSTPVIDPIYFEGTLNPSEPPFGLPWEELRVAQHALPLDELAAVWHAINKPYRLSVVYEVSVAMISPPAHRSRRVRRVEVTHVKAQPFKGRPVIQDISPRRGYAGDLLAIRGEGFESPFLKIYLNDSVADPVSKTAGELVIRISDKLPPGLYPLKVCSEEGCSETQRFEEMSPFLYRLEPNSLYVEDPDFPKDALSRPELTLWGGNILTETPPQPVAVLAVHEGGSEQSFAITSGLSRNALKWTIPVGMESGGTVLTISQGGTRVSNELLLTMAKPEVYRVDPDIVTLLPREIVLRGNHFREGNTSVYLSPINAPADSVILSARVKNRSEILCTLPKTRPGTPPGAPDKDLSNGKYQLVVEVYNKYYSEPFQITVKVGT
jgi:uncharacterized protein DUF4255/IPT/TIG domain-containing protein